MKKIFNILLTLLLIAFLPIMYSCKKEEVKLTMPDNTNISKESNMPIINMYNIDTKEIETMELEDYVCGVLAGEIFNDWPLECLKAQAILARTFTLYFLENRVCKYEGANISNDINEAQAYDKLRINDLIKQAVLETQGKVVVCADSLIETWFHSNSGGKTTVSKTGLNYLGEENYTQITDSPENESNSENFSWEETFLKSEILTALRAMGVSVDSFSSFEIKDKDASGRATIFKIGNSEFSANTFRIKIGSTKLKSTLIDKITISKTLVTISGHGYGHGVGLSQWGAKILAEEGKTCDEIINYYFDNIKIVEAKF